MWQMLDNMQIIIIIIIQWKLSNSLSLLSLIRSFCSWFAALPLNTVNYIVVEKKVQHEPTMVGSVIARRLRYL